MAIKVLDSITLQKYGLNITGLILSLKGSFKLSYITNNSQRVYIVSSLLHYYSEREKEPLFCEQVSYTINESQINENLLEYMYTMIKANYANYENI